LVPCRNVVTERREGGGKRKRNGEEREEKTDLRPEAEFTTVAPRAIILQMTLNITKSWTFSKGAKESGINGNK